MNKKRFTKEQAFAICERILPAPKFSPYNCMDCYYHDGKCEKELEPHLNCEEYRNDIYFTNMVRRDILLNPDIIKENWKELCQTDKELYLAIYEGFE